MRIAHNFVCDPQLAEISLKYKSKLHRDMMPVLQNPEDTAFYLRQIWDDDTMQLSEHFYCLMLQSDLRCLGWSRVHIGTKRSSLVDIQQLVTLALLSNASSITVAHNHPSGILHPSKADISITKRIKQAVELVDIKLNDHLILTRDSWSCFTQQGLL